MSALDDQKLLSALHRYVRACAGNPDSGDSSAVAAEREVESAVDDHVREAVGTRTPMPCGACGAE